MRIQIKLEDYLPHVRRMVKENRLREELRSRFDDNDVVQDVALRAVAHLETFRGTTVAEFLAWLRVIVSHRFNSLLRDHARACRNPMREVAFLDDQTCVDCDTPSAIVRRKEIRSTLLRAIRSLDEKQREVIVLHKFWGFTLEETAGIVDAPLATVGSRWRRGLKQLRQRLGRLEL